MEQGLISLDTETTGLDFWHGARPFLVTTYNGEENVYWQWRVNPRTRMPRVPEKDVREIRALIDGCEAVVMQNAKFDVRAMETIGVRDWPWHKTHDTLMAGHLLDSNGSHKLEDMATFYLPELPDPYRPGALLEKITKEARRRAPEEYRLARAGDPMMPSAKSTTWKFDTWLPSQTGRTARERTAVAEYANLDSLMTYYLFLRQRASLEERELWQIYLERLKVLPIAYEMEEHGVTLNQTRLEALYEQYQQEAVEAERKCVAIAQRHGGYVLTLPKSGNNKSLLEFVFGDGERKNLGVQPVARSKKTGKPSLDKSSIAQILEQADGDVLEFFQALLDKRKRDTAVNYMDGYRRFWLPVAGELEWYVLHPSLNPTGTDTLRWSSSNPNEQNISKQEGFNLRYCFGPLPGREWWALDAKNIELRIPAYEAGEEEQIRLFERPDDPPYFGSHHLLVFHLLWRDRLELDVDKDPECLLKAKKRYASTYYQWTKNGNFAVQYGAVPESGTADKAYHKSGAQLEVMRRFSRVSSLNTEMVRHAQTHGFVETIPDRSLGCRRGYPLCCRDRATGRVLPTVPLNYHIQGTAMWWMLKAMLRCKRYLDTLGPDYRMIMQVHDEIVFDFPYKEKKGNLPKINRIRRLMEQGGEDIGVPTPVGVDYHLNNWSE